MKVYAFQVSETMRIAEMSRTYQSLHGLSTNITEILDEEIQIRQLTNSIVKTIAKDEAGLENIEVAQDEFGKLVVIGNKDFYFSLSHAGKWLICAVDTKPVGVYIEQVRSLSTKELSCVLSKREQQEMFIRCDNDSQRMLYFYNLWTLKESYFEAVGRKVPYSRDCYTVKTDDDDGSVRLETDQQDDYPTLFYRRYCLDPQYKLAVCASHTVFPASITMQSFSWRGA
ncbi:4'-phosphopantetheinyl transferase family protein [Dendrosporobacter sp. 1207_IL3150]|uniref:4'-phosphopantetheinyl transferase family protein n=1 Tax=Dendrosporobacter sp. 1207_IL3150 TaxID=3084054 RepID=UPI002FD8B910